MEKAVEVVGAGMIEFETDQCGNKFWYDENEEHHRLDGPAVECPNGHKEWWRNGKLHREDGPAIEHYDGKKEYCYDGKKYPLIKNDSEWKRLIRLMVLK